MMPIAIVTAATMMNSSSTLPTAVMTESRENTSSRARIWTITPANEAVCAGAVRLLTLEPLMNLIRRFRDDEGATQDRDEVATGNLLPEHLEQGRRQLDDPRQRQHENPQDQGE